MSAYRTKAEVPPDPPEPRKPWSSTVWFGVAAYAFLWALVLTVQSSDWSSWRTGVGIMCAIHLSFCGFLFFEKVAP